MTAALTEVPGSSAVVRGGLVVYGTDLKHSLAEVNADLLAAGGPVQREVAVQLAQGARRRCGASIGLGLTGVAGPDPQDGVAVGTWHVAIAHAGGTAWTERIPTAGQQVPDRSEIRAQAARAALGLLAWQVDAVPPVGVRV